MLVKSVRLSGSDPGGGTTSTRNGVLTAAVAADGVPVKVTVTFCVTGALGAAVNVTVALWPGEMTAGEMDAEVPGGSPLREGVMSRASVCPIGPFCANAEN